MPVRPKPGHPRPARRVATAVAAAVGFVLGTAACLPEVDAPPPTALPAVAPETTWVPIDIGAPADIDRDVAEFTGPMLDSTELTLRSDDPSLRFVDGEPAEIRRITALAADGDCEQLHTTLEFWLDQMPDSDGDGADDHDDLTSSGQRASLFGRAAYDAIVVAHCP